MTCFALCFETWKCIFDIITENGTSSIASPMATLEMFLRHGRSEEPSQCSKRGFNIHGFSVFHRVGQLGRNCYDLSVVRM